MHRYLNDNVPFFSQTCDFVKKFDETVLRVAWNGDLRLINTGPKGGSARRWFFTMNGQECKDPIAIDTQLHIQARDSNIHRPAYGGWTYSGLIHVVSAPFTAFRPLKVFNVLL